MHGVSAPALAQPDHCRLMASWVAPGPAALLPRNQASALLLLLQPLYGTRRRWSLPISFLILTAFVQTFRLSPPPAHQCQAKLNIDCCTGRKGFIQFDPKIRMNCTSEPMTGTQITSGFPVPCAKFSLHLPWPTFTFQHRRSVVVCHLSVRLHSRCNATKAEQGPLI